MSKLWWRWNAWLIPELARFPDERSRNIAAVDFQSRIGTLNWRVVALLPVVICLALLTQPLISYLRVRLPFQSQMLNAIVGGGLIGLTHAAVFAVILNWVFRKPLRRFLRERLNELGVPTCIGCGYDTRGLKDLRCPECGRPIEPSAR